MYLSIDRHEKSRIAVVDSLGARISYGQLIEYMNALANYVDKRSIVFCFCKNTAGSVAGYMGLVEAGTIPLMLNAKLDQVLYQNLIEEYKPAYLWIPTDMMEQFCQNHKYNKIYEALDYSLIKTGNKGYEVNDNLQLLMTTSGSTGSPKLVRYTRRNLEANAKNVAEAFGWTCQERPLCDLGMQYTMGLNVINTHLYAGATLLLTHYNIMSGEFWDYLKTNKATNFTGVPFSYELFFRLHFERMDLPYLTTYAQGGGKLTDDQFMKLANFAKERNVRFIATFGTTETAARMTLLPADMAIEKCGSIGKAIPEGRLFLIDDDGNEITDSKVPGELCYSGPNVTMGYAVNREELKKGDDWNGTYHTGDIAKMDEDGYFYIVGRKSRFLKLLSYRVSLDQCERMIKKQFNIDCACAGTDKCMDIYVVDESHVDEIRSFISETIGLYKNLFKVHVIEEIPRNDTGKIIYKALG